MTQAVPTRSEFERVLRETAPRLLAVATRMLSNESDAHDALQDAFLQAHKSLGTFKAQAALSTWLHRIVVRACLMKLRHRKSHPDTVPPAADPVESLLPQFDFTGHRVSPGPAWAQPVALAENAELCDHLRRCIQQLPEPYRTVILLRDIEQLDPDETAALLDTSKEVVKTRLHRARQALRTLLDPYMAKDSK